jgi:hypothetical protein
MALTKVSRGLLSTSIVDNGNATAITIDSSENVVIGTGSAGEKLTIAGDVQIGESSGGEKLKFVGASSKYNFLVGKQVNVDNAFEITPSTAAGGNTFSTPAVVVNSSGNLLVGKTSTAFGTQGIALRPVDGASFTRSSGSVIDLNRLTNDGEIVGFYKDGSTVGSIGALAGRLFIGNDDTFLTFQGALDRIYPATSSGGSRDAAIDLGLAGARFKDLYLSGGVVFGSTGGSVTSKTLDDYEEGTWTPTLSFGGAAVGLAYTSQVGRYTKVGRQVTVQIGIYLSSKGTSAGGAVVNGLPFNVTTQAGGFTSYAGTFKGAGMASLSNATNVIANENTTTLLLEENNASGASALTNANFNNATYFMATVTYFT